ncbi:membrane protein [Arthrobacter phage Marchesin]|nr:membrane protein [Arthrobacter phage Marchesin]
MGRLPWHQLILGRLAEPRYITALQIVTYAAAVAAGALVVFAAFPFLFIGVLSPVVAVSVGLVLGIGGVIGVVACWRGVWWLERVALLMVALGWVLLVPSVLSAGLHPLVRTFILLLVVVAVVDCCKRYRRIDWAYLDPTK